MAEFIQSEVKVIHSVESGSPTDSDNATQPNSTAGTTTTQNATNRNANNRGMVRLGRGSVYRRIGNIAITSVENSLMREFDNLIHIESMKGDKKGLVKLQNKKAEYKYASNFLKGAVSAGVSTAILGNWAIAALFVASEVMTASNTVRNNLLENERQREREQREMYIAEKRQSRLIVGTYNRR